MLRLTRPSRWLERYNYVPVNARCYACSRPLSVLVSSIYQGDLQCIPIVFILLQKYKSMYFLRVYSRGLIKFYKHTGEKQVNFDYIMAFFNFLLHLVYLKTIVYTLVNVFIVTFFWDQFPCNKTLQRRIWLT